MGFSVAVGELFVLLSPTTFSDVRMWAVTYLKMRELKSVKRSYL